MDEDSKMALVYSLFGLLLGACLVEIAILLKLYLRRQLQQDQEPPKIVFYSVSKAYFLANCIARSFLLSFCLYAGIVGYNLKILHELFWQVPVSMFLLVFFVTDFWYLLRSVLESIDERVSLSDTIRYLRTRFCITREIKHQEAAQRYKALVRIRDFYSDLRLMRETMKVLKRKILAYQRDLNAKAFQYASRPLTYREKQEEVADCLSVADGICKDSGTQMQSIESLVWAKEYSFEWYESLLHQLPEFESVLKDLEEEKKKLLEEVRNIKTTSSVDEKGV